MNGFKMEKLHKHFYLRKKENLIALNSFLENNWEAYANSKSVLEVEIKNEKAKRSDAQNARYFGFILKQIAEQAIIGGKSYDKDTWHEFFKRKFIGEVEMPNGKLCGKSSTKLSVEEFGEFSEKVEAYAVTLPGVQFIERWDYR